MHGVSKNAVSNTEAPNKIATMSAIASTILAHKILVAIAVASLAVSGGVVATSNATLFGQGGNNVGTMSFTVNPSVNVTSLADLNFGTLNPGQSANQTSTARVDVTSSGNYTLYIENKYLLEDIFSAFSVNVTGLGSSPVVLNLYHPWQESSLSAGTYNLTITAQLTVRSMIGQSINETNLPFLGMSIYPPFHVMPEPPEPSPIPYLHNSTSVKDHN